MPETLYSRDDSASNINQTRSTFEHERVIKSFVASLGRMRGLKSVYTHSEEGKLYFITAMETNNSKYWEKLSLKQEVLWKRFPRMHIIFRDVNLLLGGEERLEYNLPEGSRLVYPVDNNKPRTIPSF